MMWGLNAIRHVPQEVLDGAVVHCLVALLDATRMPLLLLVECAHLVKVPRVDMLMICCVWSASATGVALQIHLQLNFRVADGLGHWPQLTAIGPLDCLRRA